MRRLPNWANCWVVDYDGNKLPAERYDKGNYSIYYNEQGKRISSVRRELTDGTGWVLSIFILFVIVWTWGALQ